MLHNKGRLLALLTPVRWLVRDERPSLLVRKVNKEKSFIRLTPGAKVIGYFTQVNYCHSMAILSFSVINIYYFC